jgi:hypothetical protein
MHFHKFNYKILLEVNSLENHFYFPYRLRVISLQSNYVSYNLCMLSTIHYWHATQMKGTDPMKERMQFRNLKDCRNEEFEFKVTMKLIDVE